MVSEDILKDRLMKELSALRKENADLKRKLQQRESGLEYVLARVVEELPNPIVLTDFNGRITYVNKSLEHHTGYSRAELVNQPVVILNGEKNAEKIQEGIYDCLRSNKVWDKEIIQRRKDGSSYVGDFQIFPVFGGNTNPITWACVQQDITKRKQAEDALRQQVQFLQTLIDTIPNPIYYKDANGLFRGCNKAFEEEMGFCKEEILGKTIYDIWSKELANIYTEKDLQLLNTPGVQVYETVMPFADGTLHDVLLHKGTYQDSNGEVAGLVGVIIDISERKKMEKALRESEELYRQLIELSPDVICVHDFYGRLLFINRAGAELLKARDVSELINKNIFDFVPPEYREAVRDGIKQMQEKNKPVRFFTQKFLRLDGIVVDTEAAGVPIVFRGKQAVLVIAKDITERNRHQELVRKERKRLFSLLDKLPAIVYLQANDYSIPFANRLFYERFGKPQKGKRCYEIIHGRKEPCGFCEKFNVFYTKRPQEWEWTDKNGLTYRVYNYPFYDYDGSLLLLVLGIDITKCKQAELALKQSEALYRTVFENTGTATVISEGDTITLVNTGFELLSGYSKKEVEGKKSWRQFFPEEDMEQILEYYNDGITYSDMPSRKYEARFVARGGKVKNVLVTVAVIPNTQEHVTSISDITEIKRFQQQMIRLEQLNLVGQMAAGIGHEVRNPMTTVRGFLQMFKGKKELTGYKEYIDLMIEELDRANSIITQFLSLAKDKPLEKKRMNLNTIIIKMFPLIQADVFKSNMYTQLELNNIPDLLLDEKEIRQLVLNLVRNGIEEMAEGKMLTIKTFVEANEVVLAICDQGKGIEPEVLDKLGTPFLTTKDEGTGLGLAVCYSIAARHNAIIDVKTSSEGSTFFVRFRLNC